MYKWELRSAEWRPPRAVRLRRNRGEANVMRLSGRVWYGMVGELLVRVLWSVMVWSQRELGSGRRWSGRGEAGWWLLEAAVLLFELATRRARFGRDCWMSRWVARYISVQVDSAVMFVQTLISRGGQTRPLLFGRMYDDGSRTRSLEEHGARDALTKQSPILQPITNTA